MFNVQSKPFCLQISRCLPFISHSDTDFQCVHMCAPESKKPFVIISSATPSRRTLADLRTIVQCKYCVKCCLNCESNIWTLRLWSKCTLFIWLVHYVVNYHTVLAVSHFMPYLCSLFLPGGDVLGKIKRLLLGGEFTRFST